MLALGRLADHLREDSRIAHCDATAALHADSISFSLPDTPSLLSSTATLCS
jgi:hypothetical protein